MSAKIRKFVFVLTAVILSLLTIWCETVSCSVLTKPLLNINDIGLVNFDGSDFSIFFKIIFSIWNAYFAVAIVVVLFVVITVITLFGWIIVRLVLLRKAIIESKEFDFSQKAFVISSVIFTVIGIGIAIWYSVFYENAIILLNLFLLWQEPLFMWLFYMRKLKMCLGSYKKAL